MPKPIKLSDELVNDATKHGKATNKSPAKQIEYWARIGKLADENPDLPFGFVRHILIGLEEEKAGAKITIEEDGDRIVIIAATDKPAYTLNELLKKCDLKAAMPSESEIWGNDQPVGKELL